MVDAVLAVQYLFLHQHQYTIYLHTYIYVYSAMVHISRMSANDCRGKFLCRILESGLLLSRPPEHIGRYKMLRHKKQTRSDSGLVVCLC